MRGNDDEMMSEVWDAAARRGRKTQQTTIVDIELSLNQLEKVCECLSEVIGRCRTRIALPIDRRLLPDRSARIRRARLRLALTTYRGPALGGRTGPRLPFTCDWIGSAHAAVGELQLAKVRVTADTFEAKTEITVFKHRDVNRISSQPARDPRSPITPSVRNQPAGRHSNDGLQRRWRYPLECGRHQSAGTRSMTCSSEVWGYH